MKFLMRMIPHEHEWLPIVYGLLISIRDSKTNKPIHQNKFIAGGCVVQDENYECIICGKRRI